ncbi:hypothetical protein F4802DRAFT_545930 [Xylaria palmicola]|nr:hypothetical protein F4802DRAFT_545930 [Xylaria palmicola]
MIVTFWVAWGISRTLYGWRYCYARIANVFPCCCFLLSSVCSDHTFDLFFGPFSQPVLVRIACDICTLRRANMVSPSGGRTITLSLLNSSGDPRHSRIEVYPLGEKVILLFDYKRVKRYSQM